MTHATSQPTMLPPRRGALRDPVGVQQRQQRIDRGAQHRRPGQTEDLAVALAVTDLEDGGFRRSQGKVWVEYLAVDGEITILKKKHSNIQTF